MQASLSLSQNSKPAGRIELHLLPPQAVNFAVLSIFPLRNSLTMKDPQAQGKSALAKARWHRRISNLSASARRAAMLLVANPKHRYMIRALRPRRDPRQDEMAMWDPMVYRGSRVDDGSL